jgi:DNA-binding PadR family transcriptional regulator
VSVQNVVLGELIRRRGYAYGYELLDQLRDLPEMLGYSDSVIYASLGGLEKKGFVKERSRGSAHAGTRQASTRVYYEVTAEGERHYREWMAEMPGKSPLREDLHLLLLSAGPADIPHLIGALIEFEEQCRKQLRGLVDRPLGTFHPENRSVGTVAVQDGLVSHLQTSMEWAQRTRRSLQNQCEHPAGVPGRHRP